MSRSSYLKKQHKKIGIAGCGTIGSDIAMAVSRQEVTGYAFSGIYDIDQSKARQLLSRLFGAVSILDLEQLIAASDLIFEATAKASMPDIVSRSIQAGKEVLTMSIGGFVDRPDLLELAEKKGVNLYFPSGAVCGMGGTVLQSV